VAENNGYKYNYLTLLDTYYSRKIQRLFGKAHPVFLALLHKANELKWKKKFSLANAELADLAAVTPVTVFRAREKLGSVKIGRKKLVIITEGRFNQAPIYEIRYELLTGQSAYQNDKHSAKSAYQNDKQESQSQQESSERTSPSAYQNDSRSVESAYQNDNIPNSNKIIDNDHDPVSDETKESDKRRWVLMEVGKWFATMFQVSGKREADLINAIGKYEAPLINKALEATKSTYDEGSIDSPSAALGYINGCLKNMARRQEIAGKLRAESGERSGKISNAAIDTATEMMDELEAQVKLEMEAAGGEEAYKAERKKIIQDAGFDMGG